MKRLLSLATVCGADRRGRLNNCLQHFCAEPRAAKEALGWASTTNLPEDLKERYAEYAASGRGGNAMTFDIDDKILAAVGKAPAGAAM